jgi:hypothetical protein
MVDARLTAWHSHTHEPSPVKLLPAQELLEHISGIDEACGTSVPAPSWPSAGPGSSDYPGWKGRLLVGVGLHESDHASRNGRGLDEEADNMLDIGAILGETGQRSIVVPRPHAELVTRRVLLMELMERLGRLRPPVSQQLVADQPRQAEQLIRDGRILPAGLREIERARADGRAQPIPEDQTSRPHPPLRLRGGDHGSGGTCWQGVRGSGGLPLLTLLPGHHACQPHADRPKRAVRSVLELEPDDEPFSPFG